MITYRVIIFDVDYSKAEIPRCGLICSNLVKAGMPPQSVNLTTDM